MEVEFAVDEKEGTDRTAAIEIKELPVCRSYCIVIPLTFQAGSVIFETVSSDWTSGTIVKLAAELAASTDHKAVDGSIAYTDGSGDKRVHYRLDESAGIVPALHRGEKVATLPSSASSHTQ